MFFPDMLYFSLVLFPKTVPDMTAAWAKFTPCLRPVFYIGAAHGQDI